jgi:hypothetical protein
LGADFPRPGGQARPAAPPLAFDAEQNFFGILGEPEADTLRIGAARQGPADPADREYLTLVALYKADRPVASFVVTRRRSAFESVAANPE